MVKNAVLQSADPDVAVIAGEGGNMRRLEPGVKGCEPVPVVHQQASAFCARQKLP
jgi:hypothetical protein